MKNFLNRFLAVIISSILFSLIVGWLMHTPEEKRIYECCYTGMFEGFMMMVLPIFTLYIIFGTGFSLVIDKLTIYFGIKKKWYLFQLLLYTVAGFLTAVLLSITSEGIDIAMFIALYSVPASLFFCHIFILIKLFKS